MPNENDQPISTENLEIDIQNLASESAHQAALRQTVAANLAHAQREVSETKLHLDQIEGRAAEILRHPRAAGRRPTDAYVDQMLKVDDGVMAARRDYKNATANAYEFRLLLQSIDQKAEMLRLLFGDASGNDRCEPAVQEEPHES